MKKAPKQWASEITDTMLDDVLSYIRSELTFSELMRKSGTTLTSTYSLIARATRLAYQRKRVRIK